MWLLACPIRTVFRPEFKDALTCNFGACWLHMPMRDMHVLHAVIMMWSLLTWALLSCALLQVNAQANGKRDHDQPAVKSHMAARTHSCSFVTCFSQIILHLVHTGCLKNLLYCQ